MPLNGWIPRRITSALFFSRPVTIFRLIRRGHWNLPFFAPLVSRAYRRCLTGRGSFRSDPRSVTTTRISSSASWWNGAMTASAASALRRLNQVHGCFAIANEDFLYVLSTFIFGPIRWNERFGWRLLCEQERLGYFYFWREVGRRMNIHDIPSDYQVFERFNRDYERQHYRFTEANRRVAERLANCSSVGFRVFCHP